MKRFKAAMGLGPFIRRIERLERLDKSFRQRLLKSHKKIVAAAYQNKYYTEHRSKQNRIKLIGLTMKCLKLSKQLNAYEDGYKKFVLLTPWEQTKLTQLLNSK